jgi:hypothetical protein
MDIFIAVMMVIAASGCFVVITFHDWSEIRKRSRQAEKVQPLIMISKGFGAG